MTNFGKCETCRRRKVKCDEVIPICGACRKKGRECRYTNTRDSIFVHEKVEPIKQESSIADSSSSTPDQADSVTRAARRINLQLRRSRKAEDGIGQYHTLGEAMSSRNPTKRMQHTEAILACYTHPSNNRMHLKSFSPQPALLSPQTQIAAEWSSIFGFEALQLNPLGNWIKSAWSRRGENACLDLAADYTLESMRAFRRQDQLSTSRACAKAEKALRSLQAAMESKKKTKREYLIFAVMLHCAAEQFMDISSFYYVPHVFGIGELLKSCLEQGSCNEAIRNVINLICFDEVNLSITFCRPSALENVPVPYTPVDGPHEIDLALLASDYLLVKVARLVALVRSAAEHPEEVQRQSEAAMNVQQWYTSTANTYIKKTLQRRMWTVEAPAHFAKSPTGKYFEFENLATFGLAIRHFAYRILMCGLMQTVANFNIEGLDNDAAAAQQEDIASAMSLAMCLHYALKPSNSMPMTALGLVMPLQVAHSAWYRLKKRQPSADTEEYEQAVRMKDWNMESIHALEAVWCDKACSHERMDEYAEMAAGGKAFDYAYNYKRCSADASEPGAKFGIAGEPEYQWVLDLSAGLNGLAISQSQDRASSAELKESTNEGTSQSRRKSEAKASSTVAQLDPSEVSPGSNGTLHTPRPSAPAFGRDPADAKALMRAWGYPSAGLQHFRQN